jgi:prolyl-tRNA editing enzyme YbaK/EbsC (Cys-tRNA(Pro) deacylase)
LSSAGYERGTITPFGSATALPVIADERTWGRTISIGARAHGVAAPVAADDVIAHLRGEGGRRDRPGLNRVVRAPARA